MAEVLLVALELTLGIVVPWWIVRRDLGRLKGEELDRAWNEASFWLAIVAFGPLCLPFHFTKTRRTLRGFALGLGWMVGGFAVIALLSAGAGWLLGVD